MEEKIVYRQRKPLRRKIREEQGGQQRAAMMSPLQQFKYGQQKEGFATQE